MDVGFGGRPGKSDPYLKVKLGKEVRQLLSLYILIELELQDQISGVTSTETVERLHSSVYGVRHE